MNKTASIRYAEGKMYLTTPFDPDFVSELKAKIKSRKWDPTKKQWVIEMKERAAALGIIQEFYEVTEENQPPDDTAVPIVGSQKAPQPTPLTADKIACENVQIWTDGACQGNPGPGGYGIIFDCAGRKVSKSGGFKLTTNNRMEIMAAIVALETLQGRPRVVLFSDSQYVINALTLGWARKWKANNWKRNNKDKAINPDLWDRLLKLCDTYNVEFKWVRGHDSQTENEWCDQLAVAAAKKPGLPVDAGYHPENKTPHLM